MPRGQNLFFRIYNVVRKIPRGRVATYGQVAALAGAPRAAQVVGWALRTQIQHPSAASGAGLPSTIPWHRVVNKAGMISIENMDAPKELQASMLRQEGVTVEERDGNYYIDLPRYQITTIQ